MTREQWDDRISRVSDRLWVGEVAVRAEHAFMEEAKLTRVVSILTEEQERKFNQTHPVHLWATRHTFNFGDHDEIPAATMDHIVETIRDASCERTLLHCVSGANRSTAVALCFLMKCGLTPIAAFNTYLLTRGLACAKVYNVPPRMSPQMVRSVDLWIAYNSAVAV